MSAPVLMGPNDHHVIDPSSGTFGSGLGKEAEAVLLERRARKLRQMGVVEGEDAPDVKKLKEKAKALQAAERELEAERAKVDAEKAELEAMRAELKAAKGAK